MKTYALLAFFLTTTVVSTSHGQGTVLFANNPSTAITNPLTGGRASPSAFKVSLFYLPWTSDQQDLPNWCLFDAEARNVATCSLLLPGLFDNSGHSVRIDEISPPGGNGWFQVRAWEFAFGATYEEAVNAPSVGGRTAMVLISNIFKVDTGDPTTIPAGSAASLVASGLKGFSICPEPSAIMLVLAAFGGLWSFRQRQ